MLGFILHWKPESFLGAVSRAVPTTTGVLIQFPFYGSITASMVSAKGFGGLALSDQIAHFFVAISSPHLSVVLFMLCLFALTPEYHPPVFP